MTSTVFVLFDAVTLVPAGQAAMAACRFPASVDVFVAVTNVPVNVGAVPEQPTEPLPPGVTAPHEKKPVWLAPPTENVGPLPAVKSVTVTVLVPPFEAVAPVAVLAPIAAARSPASVIGLVLRA